jgi:hypothetical protein
MQDLSKLSTEELIALRNRGAAPAPAGPAITRVPLPASTAQKNQSDLANTGSQITSRGVSDVNTQANTTETQVDTALKNLDLDSAIKNRARGVIVEDAATQEVRNQLLAVKNARQYTNSFSTGTAGGLIGRPDRPGAEGAGLAGLPLFGDAIYAGTDRAALDAALGTLRSGAKFNMIQTLKERGAAQGAQGTGLGSTAIPEFEALGRVNFNVEPDALDAGPNFLTGELNKAEETLLRRYAAVTLPSDVLVNATPEQRKALLEASYQQAVREYQNGFVPGSEAPAGGSGQRGDQGGGVPSLTPENISRQPQTIGKSEFKLIPDPNKKGLNGTVEQMIRSGSSARDIISLLETRGVPMSDVLVSTVQRNVEAYRPYAGKPLPKNLPAPRVSVEVQLEERPFLERFAGNMAGTTVGDFSVGVANGLLLGGLDEVASGGDPARMAEIDAYKRYASENSPWASLLGNIAGGVASFVPLGRGVNAVSQIARFGPNATRIAQGGVNVAAGATAGALESNEDRKAGAVIGAGSALAGDVVGNYFGGKIAGRLVDEPTAAENVIVNSVTDPNAVRGVLSEAERLGVPMGLVDSSPALRNLGGQAVRNSERAGVLADTAVGGRDVAQTDRAIATVERTLAAETNVPKAAKTVRGQGGVAADPYYKAAYARPAPSADPQIDEILQRPEVKEGLRLAQRTLANRGRDWKKLGFDLNDQGEVVLKPGASFEALDLTKRGIDDYLDTLRDDFGRLVTNDSTRGILEARDTLVTRMRELNSDYAQALDTYAPFARNAEALEMGGKAITNTKATPAQLADIVAGMDPEQQANYQIGAANAIINKIKKTKDNSDAFAVFRSEDMRQRLAAVFPDKADELANIRSITDLEGAMRRTKENLLGGSATQGRQVAQEAFAAQADSSGILSRATEAGTAAYTGGASLLPQLVRGGLLSFKNANKLDAVKNQEALAADLAPILLETDPAKAKKALDGILAKVDTYDKVKKTTRNVGGSTGAAVATGILAQ